MTMVQIHGHEVMRMMLESGKGYSRESLRRDIHEKFGADTRFYTCSAEGMDADELIQFLADRGKFIDEDSGFRTDPDRICSHE